MFRFHSLLITSAFLLDQTRFNEGSVIREMSLLIYIFACARFENLKTKF